MEYTSPLNDMERGTQFTFLLRANLINSDREVTFLTLKHFQD